MWLFLVFLSVVSAYKSFPLRRRHVSGIHAARKWRYSIRRLSNVISGAHRQRDGVYFTTICIGGQCFTAIIDTGSSSIAVPCRGCNCGSHHNYYDMRNSSLVVDTGQVYSQCYGEGSCNHGKVLTDSICMGAGCRVETGVSHPFGCCTTFAPSFQRQDADGIIGLSPNGRSLWKDLAAHHKLDKNIMSICFGKTSGELSVGGWDDSIPGTGNISASLEIQYIEISTTGNFYRGKVESMTVGGDIVPSSIFSIIIDSGSTFSYMKYHNWKLLRNEMIKYCNGKCQSDSTRNPGGDSSGDSSLSLGCYKFSRDPSHRNQQMSTFPSITFRYRHSDSGQNMVNMSIPAEQYFFLSGVRASVYCIGIFKDAQDIIGANLLANFLIVFQESPQRIGLARAQCDRKLKYSPMVINNSYWIDNYSVVDVSSAINNSTIGKSSVIGIGFVINTPCNGKECTIHISTTVLLVAILLLILGMVLICYLINVSYHVWNGKHKQYRRVVCEDSDFTDIEIPDFKSGFESTLT